MNTPIFVPLSERMRPKTLGQVVGQLHLLGEGGPLRLVLETGKVHSMVLWGPPGVGKTTLARLMADALDAHWIALSAVFSGVKDIRAAVEEARAHPEQRTVVFIDEIHRFNKSQQDALLPYTESGLITLIGATTENPSFELNRALLSRVQVYVLQPLSTAELKQLALSTMVNALPQKMLDENALNWLCELADGDARRLLQLLEQADSLAEQEGVQTFSLDWLKQVLTANSKAFDKGGDRFYDCISALHKSVRGSSPDAALYWLNVMLEAGAPIEYLARRIIRMAWEDIGLADPRAIQLAQNAAETVERLGSPEGELALSETVIYLALAAKSNRAYLAHNKARQYVKQDKTRDVPLHLRNAPTKLLRELGHGKAYQYAHDFSDAYVPNEQYFPDGLPQQNWYEASDRGLELKIREKQAYLRNLDTKKNS